jgi:hypothetical protein
MRRLLAIGVLGLAVACSATNAGTAIAAKRSAWSRPVTLDRTSEFIDSYFVSSPRGKVFYLVELAFDGDRLKLFPLEHGSFRRRPLPFPAHSGAGFSSLDLNDSGAMVVGWSAIAPDPKGLHEDDPCWCFVRAMRRHAGGRFTRVQTLSGPREGQDGPLVAIDQRGRATAAWGSFTASPESANTALRVARAPAGRAFGRARTVAPNVGDFTLDEIGQLPILQWTVPNDRLFEARPPFTHAHVVGPESASSGEGSAVASDGRGNQLFVSVDADIETSFRPAGGKYGAPRVIARTDRRAQFCDVSVALNRRGAFVAWQCSMSLDSGEGYAQAALLSRRGRLAKMSGRHPALAADNPPGIDFDERGRAVAGWQRPGYDGYFSLVGAHRRFRGFQPITSTAEMSASSVDLAIARNGRAYATWTDRRSLTHVRASSLRLPH